METHLRAAFSDYGTVEDVRIEFSNTTMSSMGYGYVRMSTVQEANAAKAALDGQLFCGRKLKVRDREFGREYLYNFQKEYFIHLRFESTQLGKVTNEVVIRNIYVGFGEIEDISIRKVYFDKVVPTTATTCIYITRTHTVIYIHNV
jgi:RNA recognition motif-containing protein